MKRCRQCGEFKPLTDFHRYRQSADGRQSRCKVCHTEANRASKARRWEREGFTQNAVINRVRNRQRRAADPAKAVAEATEWAQRNPEKKRAARAVYRALKRGDLVRPDTCERCQKKRTPIYGHHPDYAKRLEVQWLCASCHQLVHVEQREAVA